MALGGAAGGIVAGLVLFGTLALILLRPRDVSESWWAALGGLLAVGLGLVSLREVGEIVWETHDALLLLLGMMALSAAAEKAGFFEWVAALAARAGRGSVRGLYAMVFLVGTLVTAVLSLDATAIVLTPIVYGMVVRLRLRPLPFVFACAYTANTASLFLPVSNLTNLLVYNAFDLDFLRFGLVMLLPATLAVVANVAVFFVLFRGDLNGGYAETEVPQAENRAFFALSAAGIGAVLVAFFLSPVLGFSIGLAALAGGGTVALLSLALGWMGLRELAGGISWGLFVLVIGLFVVVRGAEDAGLTSFVGGWMSSAGSDFLGVLGVAVGTALGSNVVNNVPMTLLVLDGARGAVEGGGPDVLYAALLGTNVGPNLTIVGSLATLIWLSIVRGRGVEVSALDYLKVGLIATPPILLAAVFGLWVSLGLFGG